MTLKNLTIDESDLTVIGLSASRQIRSWVCRDQDVYQKYLDLNSDEAEDFYRLDTNQTIVELSTSITDILTSSDFVENATIDEILRKISILMDDQSEDKIASVSERVERNLRSSFKTEELLVSELAEADYERYISIAKNNDALHSALSDQNRRVIIFREKR